MPVCGRCGKKFKSEAGLKSHYYWKHKHVVDVAKREMDRLLKAMVKVVEDVRRMDEIGAEEFVEWYRQHPLKRKLEEFDESGYHLWEAKKKELKAEREMLKDWG